MTKKIRFCVIILSMIIILMGTLGVSAATVDVNPVKRVDTLSVTKKWYHPRANKRDYQKQPIVAKGKTYDGIVEEKGTQYEFSRYAFIADGKTKVST